MAYWWVSQNKTYQQERSGGYLWAPLEDRGGHRPHHWRTMEDLKPGDTVFSYVGQTIKAVSIVLTRAYQNAQPPEYETGVTWKPDGVKVDMAYVDVASLIHIDDFGSDLIPLLPQIYSPLNSKKTGVQGYLFLLPPKAGRLLGTVVDSSEGPGFADALADGAAETQSNETEKVALAKSRIGQGRFRDDLLEIWNCRCCVSGLEILSLLKASHIKPWMDSDNHERLDPYNGLLLGPQYDGAFDAGLITFDGHGRVVLSERISASQFKLAGINGTEFIQGLDPIHQNYLDYHRDEVFCG